jgi:hypothetical protein
MLNFSLADQDIPLPSDWLNEKRLMMNKIAYLSTDLVYPQYCTFFLIPGWANIFFFLVRLCSFDKDALLEFYNNL